MRTVQVKSIETGKIVANYHYWSTYQVKQMAQADLEFGDYLVQGTNAMSQRVSKKQWELAEKFTVEQSGKDT